MPTEREVTTEGFTAQWRLAGFAQNLPRRLENDNVNLGHHLPALGVDLVEPVDGYRLTRRATHYGMLFVLLTFGVFFLLEILSPVRLHPIQYLLIGCALSLFYLLLLALSEHLGFTAAYAVATFAIVGLISFYSRAVLASRALATAVFFWLSVLFGYLYVLLELEDAALLMGSLGLFVVLAAVMLITRKLDWYSLTWSGGQGETRPST